MASWTNSRCLIRFTLGEMVRDRWYGYIEPEQKENHNKDSLYTWTHQTPFQTIKQTLQLNNQSLAAFPGDEISL
jgi:hypothetical protein